ncbi:MAG: DUF805 domain-containing protein [Muribaculaceae bacterium]|nr:DUF805 domain-containing protein [Muribaculaceae bacterium]MDE6194192.1 DUF805 domain-containing protein [Muribaculaceae bacterium]
MYQRQVSFKEAVVRALTQNYCNFSGRASRSEYWWFYLFTCIVSWVVSIVVSLFSSELSIMYIASMVVGLAFLLPSLGIAVRRLHDIGKSGWWMFISLIPLIGAIILLVWWCKDSQMEPNEYGPVPNLVG